MENNFDFSGYATRANLRCSDGRIIMPDAFRACDGLQVPLVWNHRHDDPENVLGYAILKHMDTGMYAYGFLNESRKASEVKIRLVHGDINQMSIFANQLKEIGSKVLDGVIKEVSLVLSGANPGAFIDSVVAHSDDGSPVYDRGQGIIFTGENLIVAHPEEEEPNDETDEAYTGDKSSADDTPVVAHSEDKTSSEGVDDRSIADIYKSMPVEYQIVLAGLLEQALKNYDNESSQPAEDEQKEDATVKHNVFDSESKEKKTDVLCHADGVKILELAKSYGGGSLKAAIEAYMAENDMALTHSDGTPTDRGITNISQLFPEYQNVKPGAPEMITDDEAWVATILNRVHKSPISRIRTRQADVRNIKNRAKGYTKGSQKKVAGNINLLSRTTDPKTLYVRSDLDRDDVVDIEDFDVVGYMYNIDQMAYHEKLATIMLMGDGLEEGDEDHFDETKIRPVWTDDELYTIHVDVDMEKMRTELQGTNTAANFGENYIFAEAIIQSALYARERYKGSGNPDFFCTPHTVNVMLLARDLNGRRIFANETELKAALRVKDIVTVEQMAGRTRVQGTGTNAKTKELLGLFYNFHDYHLGSVKGGQLTHFTDFDIDFNKLKSLLEGRLSGANTRVYSAIALELDVTEDP